MIPYGRQSINASDIQAVVDVLQSDFLTQGPAVDQLESGLVANFGSRYAIALSNATAGLHCACLALGLQAGDVLWTTAVSFVASANCGKYCGASVEFVDIDPITRNISISCLQHKLKQSKIDGHLPKVLVVVHFAGLPCDMKAIAALAQEYGFYIIEDAAHAIGSEYAGKPVGACHYSDAVVFSFHPVKTIAAGEGGAVLVNDAALAKRIRQFACHGIERDSVCYQQPHTSPCYYEVQLLGFNYRLSDIHAALALSQLKRLSIFVAKRQYLVSRYNQLLSGYPVKSHQGPSILGDKVAWHIYVVECENQHVRDHLHAFLKQHDIHTNVHYIPIYQQPLYHAAIGASSIGMPSISAQSSKVQASKVQASKAQSPKKQCLKPHSEKPQDVEALNYDVLYPHAQSYYRTAITLPLYFDLSDEQQLNIIACIHTFFDQHWVQLNNDRHSEAHREVRRD
ncbi:UDP-4-amino-4,6-dideoxy-N-acetyl-beta-L-altrosamine transaminase [Marinagarivorans algicola]|uniref:UDP-4-amino-4, 6-dideoxy-N-acetyl-beta-L-altrosamine transaminase n=1 Tax=Marinagarivorans algicola TaxID=1513270 RepID=UPI0006B96912|nr:UDP-4-amino-4,6-dideoxy-N-acetyl-beta-L-altrosamine transaminase [Marinagarivorans algicola]